MRLRVGVVVVVVVDGVGVGVGVDVGGAGVKGDDMGARLRPLSSETATTCGDLVVCGDVLGGESSRSASKEGERSGVGEGEGSDGPRGVREGGGG